MIVIEKDKNIEIYKIFSSKYVNDSHLCESFCVQTRAEVSHLLRLTPSDHLFVLLDPPQAPVFQLFDIFTGPPLM